MRQHGKKRQREEAHEVFLPRNPAGRHEHVKKHLKRDKGLEVVFDPKAHKEYLTGFHKRKVARRKEALKKLEKRQREQRLEERAERRQATKEELARLGAAISDSEPEDEEGGQGAGKGPWQAGEQRVITSGNLTSTVTIMPMKTGFEDSDEEAEEEEEEAGGHGEEGGGGGEADEEGGRGGRQHGQQQQQAWRGQQPAAGAGGEGQQAQQGRKLSKTALRIMTKTKLKIEGKRAGGAGKGGSGKGGKGGSGGGGKGKRGGGGGGGKKGGGRRGGRK